jgi:predicted nuclease with TOPRIM domain
VYEDGGDGDSCGGRDMKTSFEMNRLEEMLLRQNAELQKLAKRVRQLEQALLELSAVTDQLREMKQSEPPHLTVAATRSD